MQSASKVMLTQDTVQTLMAHHLGANAAVAAMSELTDGYYNAAYRIELADGRIGVLKVSPPPDYRVLRYEQNIMAAEVAVMELVRARTSLPVPGILCQDMTRQLISSEFYLMEFAPGVALNRLQSSLSQERRDEIDRRWGSYLRELNEVPGSDFGLCAPDAARFGRWREAYDWLLQAVLADGRDAAVDLGMPYDALYSHLAAHYDALDEVAEPRLVHWDLWSGNICVDPDAGRITGIFDFERALWGDPVMEVNFTGPMHMSSEAFMEGYGRAVPATEGERMRRTLYDAYVLLVMIIECYYRHYPTDDQERWARTNLAETLEKL